MNWRTLSIVGLLAGVLSFVDTGATSANVPSLENGDWNGDLEIDISDAVCMLDWFFMGGAPCAPVVCEDSPGSPPSYPVPANGDTNGDSEEDISDVIVLLHYLFLGGPAPVQIECRYLPPTGE